MIKMIVGHCQGDDTGYEYDNIQIKLSRMNETELQSDYAHKLMDRAAQIRKQWRK